MRGGVKPGEGGFWTRWRNVVVDVDVIYSPSTNLFALFICCLPCIFTSRLARLSGLSSLVCTSVSLEQVSVQQRCGSTG